MLSPAGRGLGRLVRDGLRAAHCVSSHAPIRYKCTLGGNRLNESGTGGFELAFLGTSSQGGARRYPSCLALRLRGPSSSEVWLFDAGEGAVSQLQRSTMRVGLVRNIFVTHLHGDHLYGLPGLVMSILGRRDAPRREDETLNVWGPQGVRAFLRTSLGVAGFRIPGKNILRINELVWPTDFGAPHQNYRHGCARPYWKCAVKRLPFEIAGRDIEAEENEGRYTYTLTEEQAPSNDASNLNFRRRAQNPAGVLAAPVLHTVPTFGFMVTENVIQQRFDKTKLSKLGIPIEGSERVRDLFQQWLTGRTGTWDGQEIDVEEVVHAGRAPRRICIIGDTYDAGGAAHIAQGADVLVHEATNVAAQTHIARARGHSSTLGASRFAKKVGAKRLILNHTSVSYSERKIRSLEIEARGMFGTDTAFVARDLSVFSIPTCEEDHADFVFRRFVGFTDSMKEMRQVENALQGKAWDERGRGISAGARGTTREKDLDDEDTNEEDDSLLPTTLVEGEEEAGRTGLGKGEQWQDPESKRSYCTVDHG